MIAPVHQVVAVGIDDGDADGYRAALAVAVREARLRGAVIKLVHGCGPRHPARTFHSEMEERSRRGRGVLRNAARHAVRMAGPGIRVLVTSSPLSGADALIAESESATLLVLQRRNLGKLNRIYSGSTTSGLAARARCPVVVVRADYSGAAGSTPGGVVVGVDGSGRSQGALREAWFEASARSGKLIVVHAWDVLAGGAPYYGHVAPTEQEIAAARASAELLLAEALAGLAEEYPDVAVQRVLRRGPAVDSLVEAAAGAELLVISRHRDSAIERIALGSKAQELLDRAPCPVLIAAPGSAGNLRGP